MYLNLSLDFPLRCLIKMLLLPGLHGPLSRARMSHMK